MSWFRHRPKPKDGVAYSPKKNTPIQRQLKEENKQKKEDKKNGPTNTYGRC